MYIVMIQMKKEIKPYPEVSTDIQTSQSQGQARVLHQGSFLSTRHSTEYKNTRILSEDL